MKINTEKINKIANELKKSYFTFKRNARRIYNEETFSKKEIDKMLDENATVENLYRLTRYVAQHMNCTNEDHFYHLYDVALFDDSESYVKRNGLLNNIFKSLGLKDIIVFRYSGNINHRLYSRYCFVIHRGRNGSGDFVDVDMKEITDIIHNMKCEGAETATPVDVSIDVLDDVSDWVIAFTLNGGV